jgi:hypothetical protein
VHPLVLGYVNSLVSQMSLCLNLLKTFLGFRLRYISSTFIVQRDVGNFCYFDRSSDFSTFLDLKSGLLYVCV